MEMRPLQKVQVVRHENQQYNIVTFSYNERDSCSLSKCKPDAKGTGGVEFDMMSKVTNWDSSPKKIIISQSNVVPNLFDLMLNTKMFYSYNDGQWHPINVVLDPIDFLSLYGQKQEMFSMFGTSWERVNDDSFHFWVNYPTNKTFRDAILPRHQTDLCWLEQLHWNTADAVCFSHPASLHCLCWTKSIYSKPRFV